MTNSDTDAPVTVLFSDCEGSTDLHARLGDAEARRVLGSFEQLTRAALADHDGQEIKGLGDGLLATFSSARKAVRCAVAIQQAVAARAAATADGPGVRVRVGINTGEVISSDGDVFGLAVNAAARIVGRASGSQILVADVVKHLVGSTSEFTFVDRGRSTLKGLPGQWILHEVLWQEGARPTTYAASAPELSLIGRRDALEVAEGALDGALAGGGQLVLLTGDAGIGKTAVVREVAAVASQRGARVLWGVGWDGAGAPPYWPWVQILRGLVQQTDERALSADLGAVRAELSRLVPELVENDGTPPAASADADHARFALNDAVASVLARAARRTPLIVVLDDLHWADEASLLVLAFIARQLPSAPLLLLGTYREAEVASDPVAGPILREVGHHGTVLPLRGLGADEVAGLMATVLGEAPDAAFARRVQERSAGNPFFVRELARLHAAQPSSTAVPEGIRDVVERRLARLPQPSADVLSVASVVGQEFTPEFIAVVTGQPVADVLDTLDNLARASVVVEPTGPASLYRFGHDLYRETVYGGLGSRQRAALHLAVADALEHDERDGYRVHPAEPARHLGLAGGLAAPARVATAAARAAAYALGQLAFEEAIAYYERAVDALADDAAGVEGDRVELLLALASAHARAGHGDDAREAYTSVYERARRAGLAEHAARAVLGLDGVGALTGRPDGARFTRMQESLDLLEAAPTELRARLLAAMSRYLAHADYERRSQAQALSDEAVEVAREVGDPATLAYCLLAQHDSLWLPASAEVRLPIATEIAAIAESVGRTGELFEARLVRYSVLLELGRVEAAHEFELLVALADELAQPRLDYFVLSRQAVQAIIAGDLEGGRRLSTEAYEVGKAVGEADALLVHWIQVGTIDRDDGLRAEAAVPTESLPFQSTAAQMLRGLELALADVASGRLDAAARHLDAAREVMEFAGLAYAGETYWAYFGEVARALGNDEDCRQAYQALLPSARFNIIAGAAVSFLGCVSHHLGLLALHLGDRDAARAHLQDGLEMHERLGARCWWARSAVALGGVLTAAADDRERGERLLREGRDAAAEIGMPWLVAEAEAHLASSLDAASGRPTFVRQGAVWELGFAGVSAHLKDSKGLRDLARIIDDAGSELHVSELVGFAEAGGDVVLDDRAKAEYRRRLADVEEEAADAEAAHDLERASRAVAERDAIIEQLSAALGLGGRSRRLGDPAERARKAVGGRIRDALARIDDVHPSLGAHLRARVTTGTFCCYRPQR